MISQPRPPRWRRAWHPRAACASPRVPSPPPPWRRRRYPPVGALKARVLVRIEPGLTLKISQSRQSPPSIAPRARAVPPPPPSPRASTTPPRSRTSASPNPTSGTRASEAPPHEAPPRGRARRPSRLDRPAAHPPRRLARKPRRPRVVARVAWPRPVSCSERRRFRVVRG